jgi:hypothetical protein
MNNIIESLSESIAKEIISRPKFDVLEISNIIKVRIKDSLLDILLENVQKEEAIYLRLLIKQSELPLGSKEYVKLGYQLSIAKHKKAVANRAVNNVRNRNKIAVCINYIKENFKDFDINELYKVMDESEVGHG